MTTACSPASEDVAQVFDNLAGRLNDTADRPAGEEPAVTATRWHAGESRPTTAPRRYRWSCAAARRWFAWANTIGSRSTYTRRTPAPPVARPPARCLVGDAGADVEELPVRVPAPGSARSGPRRPVSARVAPHAVQAARPGRVGALGGGPVDDELGFAAEHWRTTALPSMPSPRLMRASGLW